MASDPELQPSKRAQKKSKTGCKTCKIRKVKCDEIQPVCSNCKIYFSGRAEKCEYDFGKSAKVKKLLRQSEPVNSALGEQTQLSRRSSGSGSSPEEPISNPPKYVGISNLDQMIQITGESKLPKADYVFHQFLGILKTRNLPVGITTDNNEWAHMMWPLVQSDELYLHVMLLVNAFGLGWRHGDPNMFRLDMYKKEVIRMLRDRVQSSTAGVSDGTISAVIVLASFEFMRKNMAGMTMHLDGVKRMVAIRGGLKKIKDSSPAVANLVYRLSLMTTQESQFPPEAGEEYVEPWIEITEFPGSQLDLYSFGLEIGAANLMQEVRKFVYTHFRSLGPRVTDVYTDSSNILQRVLHFQIISEPQSQSAHLSEACRYACGLILFLVFQNHIIDETLLMNDFLHKLKSALNKLVPFSGPQNKLILWLLAIGGVQALKLPEKAWFVGHLVTVSEYLDIYSWEDMKVALKSVVWVETLQVKGFDQLWEEIRRMSEFLAEENPFSDMSETILMGMEHNINEETHGDIGAPS